MKGDLEENKKRITDKIKMKIMDEIEHKHIILDCSCMNYVDTQGVDTILKVDKNKSNQKYYKLYYFNLVKWNF